MMSEQMASKRGKGQTYIVRVHYGHVKVAFGVH